jgi:hypothetical protein
VVLPEKSDETWKTGFRKVSHFSLSPNFFYVSLLIGRLAYDSNKI